MTGVRRSPAPRVPPPTSWRLVPATAGHDADDLLHRPSSRPRPRRPSAGPPEPWWPPGSVPETGWPSACRRRRPFCCVCSGPCAAGIVPVLLNATLLPAERDALVADADPALTVSTTPDSAPPRRQPVDCRPIRWPDRSLHVGTHGPGQGRLVGVLDEEVPARLFEEEADLWGFGPADTHLVCSPMYHSVSIRFAAGTLFAADGWSSCRASTPPGGHRHRRHRPTTTFLAPTALQRLLTEDADPAPWELVPLWSSMPGPLPARAQEGGHAGPARGPLGVLRVYRGQFTACGPDEWMERPGTVGRARPGRHLRVDDDGAVWCRCPPLPASATGATTTPPPGPGGVTSSLSGIWADSMPTGTSFSMVARRPGDHRRGERLSGRGGVRSAEAPGVVEVAVFGLADEPGANACAPLLSVPPPRRHCGTTRRPFGPLQAPEDLFPSRRTPADRHRQAPPTGPPDCPRARIRADYPVEVSLPASTCLGGPSWGKIFPCPSPP